jgi:hypothetical protein
MRPKTLILSTAGLGILGLAFIILGMNNAALAQEKGSSFPLPTLKSPIIAPVPVVSPEPPKPEENTPDQRPKLETSAQAKTRHAASAVQGLYYVGVIPGSASCPAGSELITIHMDDEDHNNANSRFGWIGAIVSDKNTTFVFCRVDGTQFNQVAVPYPYAVLQLSPQCPAFSMPFSRYFDNEDSSNQNGGSGNISPNVSAFVQNGYTELHFCLFPPNQLPMGTSFPNLGIEYGVFASNLLNSGLVSGQTSGHLHTDDEDNSNENNFDFAYYNIPNTWASQIISGGTNTDISIVKVRNASPPPPPCLKKVLSYNGNLLNAFYDGANCYIKPVVSGATPFIYSDRYYVTADKSTQCLAGSWDSANCYFMPKPGGGFLYKDAFYVTPGPGHTCSLGTFDGANCLVQAAPWGTHAFEYQNKWYFTPKFTCKDGAYDSANCYVMKAPAGTLPFIFNNAFYYHE